MGKQITVIRATSLLVEWVARRLQNERWNILMSVLEQSEKEIPVVSKNLYVLCLRPEPA